MTPGERDEVRRIAAGLFACEPHAATTMDGLIKLCNAVLRYVPAGVAVDPCVVVDRDVVVIVLADIPYSPADARRLAHAINAAADAAEED